MVPISKQSGNKRNCSPRKQYLQEDLERAIEEAQITGKIRRTAKKYRVPFSTVQRYIRTPPKSQIPGPGTVLTAEEEARIKTWILYMSKAGFPLSESGILDTVIDYADKIRKKRDIPETFPCKNWTRRFLKRHPDLRKKRTTRLSKAGALVTEEQIRYWFQEVEETLQEDGIELTIFEEPERIFNFDESGFKLVPNEFSAICGPNVENTYQVHNNCDKDSYTALFGSNAAGELTPPMVLYPGKRMTRDIVESTPEGWSVGVSAEGWQTSKTFYEYMTNDFHKWLLDKCIQFPIIVFVDGHKSHISIELTEFCTTHGIVLIALFPNSTRILQPLDRQFFGPFKQIWGKVLRQYLLAKNKAKVTKLNFCALLKTALDNFTNSEQCLKKAFKMCGLSPWDVNEVDFSRLPTNMSRACTESTGSATQETANSPERHEPENDQHEFQVQLHSRGKTALLLHYIEKGLNEDQLTRFALDRKKDFWYGPLDELALFNYWKSIKDKSEGFMFTEPLEQFQSITLELTVEDDGTCTPLVQQSVAQDESLNRRSLQADEDVKNPAENAAQEDPFEGILIWPKVNDKSNVQKRRRQKHVPSVATSNRWRQWYDKKDAERKQEKEAKIARAEERKLVRMKKEQEQDIKKKKREEKLLQKEKLQQEKENNPPPRKKKKTLQPNLR